MADNLLAKKLDIAVMFSCRTSVEGISADIEGIAIRESHP